MTWKAWLTTWIADLWGNDGGKTRAAQEFGISRQTLYSWLEEPPSLEKISKILQIFEEETDIPKEELALQIGHIIIESLVLGDQAF